MKATVLEEIKSRSHPLGQHEDLESLVSHIKDRRIVMLGEASHGTHEYYHWRALISHELITKHGFNFIAVEGDWPACQSLDQYVKSTSLDKLPFKDFVRWPGWMWANEDIRDFTTWLRFHNRTQLNKPPVGFHGLDIYSLFESIEAILKTVHNVAPESSESLRDYYTCFGSFQKDEKKYMRSLFRNTKGCQEQAVAALEQLLELKMLRPDRGLFDAIQNARVIKNAESYYRAMTSFEDNSWNVRDRHMLETLQSLLTHYGSDSKAIVWAHNTHIGDYRATDMAEEGSVNLGGLAREVFGDNNVGLVGFGSYEGSVIASHSWAGPVETLRLPPALPDSYENMFHRVTSVSGFKNFYLNFQEADRSLDWTQRRGHRAVGVVYDPRHERGNYVPTELAKRYDAFVFFDQSRALTPLKLEIDRSEIPETYPSGM